jgi:proton-coupled amino acid transporter
MEEPLKDRKIKKNRQTTYFEAFTHILKGNIGSCIFALSSAFKSSGIIFGPLVTILLAIVCVDQQHVLINCSNRLSADFKIDRRLDYAETLELSLISNEKLKKYAKLMRRICNSFLVITQLGFCAVYFLFIGSNLKNILDFYGYEISLLTLMQLSLFPILATALVTNLKYLSMTLKTFRKLNLTSKQISAPFSLIGNLCMFSSIAITFYYSIQDLPSISDRKLFYSELHQLPLFVGTVMYLYEGIGMVLPFKNSMKRPNEFSRTFGVLNVGMVVLTVLFLSFGCIGYWKYGEDVKPSLSLNLPIEEM